MLTTRIFLAAMSRANLSAPELAKLPNFYFYVDEFQNFANETFAEILSEARKYKLNLVIAHQYIEQMEEEVRDAVFGNMGTTVVFRVGPFDAEVLETIFLPHFTKEDVVALDRRQVYLSLMIDGVGSAPFSAVTIPPIEAPPVSYREQVIVSSREQFTTARAGIEKAIVDELRVSAASPAPFDARMKKKPVHPSPKASEGAVQRASVPQAPIIYKTPPLTPRPAVERPILPSKSADDLKAILRTMTAKNGAEKEQKQTQHKESLKGALAGVLAKKEESFPPAISPPPTPNIEKKPFEVSEDALRKVLKGDT